MITIELEDIEYYDSTSNRFMYANGGTVRFEYSLKVLYDWEAKWRKPFLKGELTDEETIDFYLMMALDPIDERCLTEGVMEVLGKYIGDTNTATTFSNHPNGQNGNMNKKKYTAEEIYALMFAAGVPLEFEERNLNRLLVILRIIASHNQPPKKMTREEILRQNAKLNAERKAKYKTKG